MCGRYLLDMPGSQLATALDAVDRTGDFSGTWNAAPGQDLPVLRADAGGARVLERLRWGFVPPSAGEDGAPARMLVNARGETVARLPAFRDALRERRCVVPAHGFYEWQKTAGGGKQPYCIRRQDDGILELAGIWTPAVDARTGEVRDTYAIVTTTPSDDVRELHDRMPVVLDDDEAQAWLTTPPEGARELLQLLRPYAGRLRSHPVSKDVGKVDNDHPGLADPVEPGSEVGETGTLF